MQKAKVFFLRTDDQEMISATYFGGSEKSQHLIIIGPAAAAPQGYYRKFAEYASTYKDFDVVTFDYRGVGASLNEPVTMCNARMSDWGTYDLKAIIDWADKKYDKIFILGHSVSGQLFPKASNHHRIHAAYFVGSQFAYFGHWKGLPWLKVMIFWLINIPLTTFLFGYMPGWAMAGKIPLPSKIALEWRKWALNRQGVLQGEPELVKSFAAVRIPLHFVNIEDDRTLAPVAATQALMHCYKNASTSYQYIKPKDLGIRKIGHFGFFKSISEKKLWSMPMFYFTQYVRKLN